MCGIVYSQNKNGIQDLATIKRRGPEGFKELQNDFGYFAHSLLNTIAEPVAQPLTNKHGVLLYNGSTYNNNSGNDSKWLSEQLDDNLVQTIDVIRSLRGEYALVYVNDTHIVFCADEFHQRNLWYYVSQNLRECTVSSIPKTVSDKHGSCWYCEENKIYVVDKSNMSIHTVQNRQWNFDQKINHFDYVIENFDKAIRERHDSKITTNLHSSGHDSGAIDCATLKHTNNYKSIVTVSGEIKQILNERYKKHKFQMFTTPPAQKEKQYLFENTIDSYQIWQVGEVDLLIQMYRYISENNKHKVVLTGNGGDEIYNDWKGQHNNHFKGRTNGCFPENLQLVWPWFNYTGRLIPNNQRADFIAGWFGLEVRNPMQDQDVVQAWLNTTNDVKNNGYKPWVEHYLKQNHYPFAQGSYGKTHFGSEPTAKTL